MPNFDYHQGRIQPYSVEPSDHRLYVQKKKKKLLLKLLIEKLWQVKYDILSLYNKITEKIEHIFS